MNENLEFFNKIFSQQVQEEKYTSLGLNFNPFPKSGTANILGSDSFNQKLIPVDDSVLNNVFGYLKTAFTDNPINPEDKLAVATITGNYGSGKTQVLLFVKSYLLAIADQHLNGKKPYVLYIDNPGVNLLELIGLIISKIGEEDLKKFIWGKIIKKVKSHTQSQNALNKFVYNGGMLFPGTNPDPYSDENSVSYKKFLNSFVSYLKDTKERKEFDETLKETLLNIFEQDTNDTTLSQYFYEFISSDYGVNKTWEALSTGSIKTLNGKEAKIIAYIVELVKEQGFTDFFILVDEFEDLTEGRLTKPQIDNYLYNLRILLDKHREWCLLFAMTSDALKKLRGVSPPLADRISSRLIIIQKLFDDTANKIVENYLNLARDKVSNNLHPFTVGSIKKLNDLVDGNARRFLRNCYSLIEVASETFDKSKQITPEFVETNFLQG